jgi:hypothetical protein
VGVDRAEIAAGQRERQSVDLAGGWRHADALQHDVAHEQLAVGVGELRQVADRAEPADLAGVGRLDARPRAAGSTCRSRWGRSGRCGWTCRRAG